MLLGLFFTDDMTIKMFIIASVRSVYGVVRGVVFLPIYGAYCLNLKYTYFYKSIFKSILGLMLSLGGCWLLRFIYVPDDWIGFFIMCLLVTACALCVGGMFILTKTDKHYIFSKLRSKLK